MARWSHGSDSGPEPRRCRHHSPCAPSNRSEIGPFYRLFLRVPIVGTHVIPTLGRITLRRLRYQQIESLYDSVMYPTEGRALAPKTVYEIRLVIRGALAEAHRRGLVTRNVADLARPPSSGRCNA